MHAFDAQAHVLRLLVVMPALISTSIMEEEAALVDAAITVWPGRLLAQPPQECCADSFFEWYLNLIWLIKLNKKIFTCHKGRQKRTCNLQCIPENPSQAET